MKNILSKAYEILNQEICVRSLPESFKAFNGTFLFVENTFPLITSYNCEHCVPYYYNKITHLILREVWVKLLLMELSGVENEARRISED